MNSVGIDLHRKRSHVAVLDERRQRSCSRGGSSTTRRRSSSCSRGSMASPRSRSRRPTAGSGWPTFLEEAGYELHLAHPLRTKAIASARVKTDAVDARTLAHLLRADLLPEAYIAPRELRDLRDLLRHRVALTRMRSALKQRVGAILAKHGIQRPYSNLFGPGGMRFLAELELREGPAAAARQPAVADRRLRPRDRCRPAAEIDQRAKADPYVEVLCQIRGIGRYIAMLVIAEVGDISALPLRPPPLRLGRADPDRPQLRRQGPARPHHRPGLAGAALGARSRPPSTPPAAAARCATPTSGSASGAASRSPRSPSPARS